MTFAPGGVWTALAVALSLGVSADLARAQAPLHVRRVVLVPLEKRMDPGTNYMCFRLLDDDRTDPEIQIVVSLSAAPALFRVWLVDSAGALAKVSGVEGDSIIPWEVQAKEDSAYYPVEWQNLRPLFPGRGVYKLRVELPRASKVHSQKFVLQRAPCKK